MSAKYKKIYWGEDKSTEVTFEEFHEVPSQPVTSCFIAAFDKKGNIAMAKPNRGWGLPGGHVETGENAFECVAREAKEECGIEIENAKIIGGWHAKKIIDTSANKKYPLEAFQLLFIGDICSVDKDFSYDFEVSERAFIPADSFLSYHHSPKDYAEIIEYIMKERKKDKHESELR